MRGGRERWRKGVGGGGRTVFTNPSMDIFVCLQLCRNAANAICTVTQSSPNTMYAPHVVTCNNNTPVKEGAVVRHQRRDFSPGRLRLWVSAGLDWGCLVFSSAYTHKHTELQHTLYSAIFAKFCHSQKLQTYEWCMCITHIMNTQFFASIRILQV